MMAASQAAMPASTLSATAQPVAAAAARVGVEDHRRDAEPAQRGQVHAPEGAAAHQQQAWHCAVHGTEWAGCARARQALDGAPRAAWHRAMRPLTADDLPRAAALSRLVGWNQVQRDWALFVRAGRGPRDR